MKEGGREMLRNGDRKICESVYIEGEVISCCDGSN